MKSFILALLICASHLLYANAHDPFLPSNMGIDLDNIMMCALNFTCPSDDTVDISISPLVMGEPIVTNPGELDTIYYSDAELTICDTFGFKRTWVLEDTCGNTYNCMQLLYLEKDTNAIIPPKDTIFQGCLSNAALEDCSITGYPTIYDVPLVDYQYTLGWIITKEDSIVSPTMIKRKFFVIDWCLPAQPPAFVGCQYISTDFPNFDLLELTISDPLQTTVLSEICNNDPIHLCQLYGNSIPSHNGVDNITWQYNDDGTGWVDETDPAFGDFCFVVPPGKVNTDCASSTTGFVERAYRANIDIVDLQLMDTCMYTSDVDTLLICCPVDIAYLQVDDDSPMCEGDMRTVQVDLKGAPFLETYNSASFITISWTIDGVPMPGLDNMPTISHAVTAGTTDFCFSAIITNCGGKQVTVSICIPIDPKPICGTITGLPAPANLTQDLTNPNLYYICPGDDAAIGIDQPFSNCIPQWEYSFDLIAWNGLGYSNSIQNTNVLPTPYWQSGASSIYYRIACQPLSNPSACDPCYSDTLEIQLLAAPLAVSITGNSPVCAGNSSTLSINPQQNPVLPITYTWLCNGLVVGTGNTYAANQNGCYWVEASDGCQVTESNQFCLDVCETVAVISCPQMPNECAYLGHPVTLSGCDSYSSCSNASFNYQWSYNNGTLIQINGCTIEHLPDPAGTTYTLMITDLVNGCTATTTRFVKPCAP